MESVKLVLILLRTGKLDTAECAADTRPVHLQLFSRLVPDKCPYYAGHYRGEDFACLRYSEVKIAGDSRVGWPASEVSLAMASLETEVRAAVKRLDGALNVPHSTIRPEDRLRYAVAVVCAIFEKFLCIHPYLNGNGHVGRFLIWAILGRYGYWPIKFAIEPRPPDPPYTDLIRMCRDGNHQPLEKYILRCLAK
jgi:fido (protein-threonine AMPylation protein)